MAAPDMLNSQLQKLDQLLAGLNEQILANPLTQQLWSFYESRTTQQRQLIRVLLVILLAVVVWFGFLMPLAAYANNAQEDYLQAKADLAWMQANRAQAQQATALKQQTIAEIIPASALSPYVTELKPNEDGDEATLVLNNVPFNQLVESLHRISLQNGIQVSNATLERKADRSGYVDATLTLSRN